MYAPARHDEITTYVGYLDEQLTALRSALFGLTEEQARQTPCASALSLAGLLKHAVYCMTEASARLADPYFERTFDEAAFARFGGSFALTDEETAVAIIAEFDALRAEFVAAVRQADPDADAAEPAAPWNGRFASSPIKVRYFLAHQIEEYARHAGHADIIREQIDGQQVPGLVATLAGAQANDFFTPFEPEPGTLLA